LLVDSVESMMMHKLANPKNRSELTHSSYCISLLANSIKTNFAHVCQNYQWNKL